jgi:hypothetical protein
MPAANVFRWLDGRGWLIFSGGENDDIRASALNRTSADGALALFGIGLASDQLLIDLEDMGAPAGYMVDPAADEDAVILDKLIGAGLVFVTGAKSAREARANLIGAALEGMQTAYESGAVILVEGEAIAAFGTWMIDGEVRDGLEWVDGAALVIGGEQEDGVIQLLQATPAAVVVGIKPGSALAFGPDGQIEIWGEREIIVRLGSAYSE